jgi:hypothetical protein
MNARRITPNSAACLPSTLQALSRIGAPFTPGGGVHAQNVALSPSADGIFSIHEEILRCGASVGSPTPAVEDIQTT